MENWRIKFIFFFLFCFAAVVIFRLYYLQIKKGEHYKALALGQQISSQEIEGKRGEIFFRDKSTPLAKTEKRNLIYIYPEKILKGESEEKVRFLDSILEETEKEIYSLLGKGKTLKREVSQENLEKVRESGLEEDIKTEELWGRIYPQEEIASHIVGFLNEEMEGQYGIEGYYDEILKGVKGFKKEGKSPFGYLTSLFGTKKENDFQGADIFLTLDYNIQYFSEKVLKEAKEVWDIDSGQVLVSNPNTGKILAAAVFPSFNPNKYGQEKDLGTFINPLTQKLFEPGSVFKPLTFAAAIEENLIEPNTTYEDKGCVELGGPPICNFQKRVWGEQKMTDVLEESINTGAVFVEQKIGENLFLEYLKDFNLFEKTGVDLQGEEFSLNETLKNGYARDFATASFGQGIEVTPIQLVQAFSSIANGGYITKPLLVDSIVYPSGEVVEIKPEIKKKVLSADTCAKLTSMLISVIENGSGRRTKIDGYFIAGKTGTAQVPLVNGKGYSQDETIQSFIGFFPALDPEIIILIKLDNPKNSTMSGHSVVPLFGELAKYIIDSWQIPPSY